MTAVISVYFFFKFDKNIHYFGIFCFYFKEAKNATKIKIQ